ncbi:BrnA antitoxin family protein [Caballeronia sp. 15715]|uniref:BrnA antitoxin family protein n=1 Tax=unclassified Caballeronia TaxID=2646786 RepID=UPI0039E6C260
MTAKLKKSPRTWVDPDDAPEITDDWIAGADLRNGKQIVRRGRPLGSTKTPTTVRLDNDVLEAFRATGPRWQSRLNAALADWLKTHSPDELAV